MKIIMKNHKDDDHPVLVILSPKKKRIVEESADISEFQLCLQSLYNKFQ